MKFPKLRAIAQMSIVDCHSYLSFCYLGKPLEVKDNVVIAKAYSRGQMYYLRVTPEAFIAARLKQNNKSLLIKN